MNSVFDEVRKAGRFDMQGIVANRQRSKPELTIGLHLGLAACIGGRVDDEDLSVGNNQSCTVNDSSFDVARWSLRVCAECEREPTRDNESQAGPWVEPADERHQHLTKVRLERQQRTI